MEPWLTFDAIHWLDDWLTPNDRIFEWGSGGSTPWFAERVAEIISVESSKEWFNKLQPQMPENVIYYFRANLVQYVQVIKRYHGFNLIVIDGKARPQCISNAIGKGKIILLDNSDRKEYAVAMKLLDDSMTSRRDFPGEGRDGTWMTSLWFQ